MSIESVMPPNHLILRCPFSSCPQSLPTSGSFPVSWLFVLGGPSVGVSTSVIPMNIQSWFPFGLTDLISLLPKGPSRVFSTTTIWKHKFFSTQPPLMVQFSHSYTLVDSLEPQNTLVAQPHQNPEDKGGGFFMLGHKGLLPMPQSPQPQSSRRKPSSGCFLTVKKSGWENYFLNKS